jgi:hypothetical protein
MRTSSRTADLAIVAFFMLLTNSGVSSAAGLGYADVVLAKNPVAFWRLNETSGTTMVDASGNGHDGTYTSVALGATGVGINSDKAGTFNGTSSKSLVPDDSAFNLLNFTVEAWMRLVAPTAGDLRVMNQQDGSNYWLLHLNQVSPGDYQLTAWYSLDGVNNVHRGPNLNDGGFHHIAITRDTVNDLLTFYVDGAQAGTAVATASNVTYTIASDVAIGSTAAGSQFFPGIIDEAVIYNTALTAAQIQENYLFGLYGVPEPSTMSLVGLAVGGYAIRRRVQRRK